MSMRLNRSTILRSLTVSIALALFAFVLSAGQPNAAVQTSSLATPYSFSCVVQGSPTEFPDDIYVKNTSTKTVVKGTKLHWSVPNTTRQGDWSLTADLAPGAGVMISGVIGGGMAAGSPCAISVKPAAAPLTASKATLALAAASAQPIKLVPSVSCKRAGTPVEFPNQIYVTNDGPIVVPKGTKMHWSLAGVNTAGDYVFAADLPRGQGLFLPNVNVGGIGGACTAKIIQ